MKYTFSVSHTFMGICTYIHIITRRVTIFHQITNRTHVPSTGVAISLFGTIGPQNSPYSVQLDDWPNKTFQANKMIYTPQTLLFHADNLGQGDHTLVVTNEADQNLQIDYATLHRFASPPSRFVES